MADKLLPGGVIERAEHAGDVPQRRRGRPAHRERHRRLALEVQRDPALRAEQHLPEMVVTVDALDGDRPGKPGRRRHRPT